jgi:hypothetical protein
MGGVGDEDSIGEEQDSDNGKDEFYLQGHGGS